MSRPEQSHDKRLLEIVGLFAKLGLTGFGGPAAHISMMFDKVVKRRQWLKEEEFLDLMGATNLIPGPNSTGMAIHLGHRRGGWPGLLLAGSCFIFPAALIVLACAWAYAEYGSLPDAEAVLYGVKAVIIGVVAQALWRLGRTALKTKLLGAICIAGIALGFAGVNAGSLSLMAVVSYTLAREAIVDVPSILLATLSSVLLMRFHVNSAWLVLAGAIVGLAIHGRWP